VAILSLALAIGPKSTIFSVVDRVFFRPASVPGISHLYKVHACTEEPGSEGHHCHQYMSDIY